MLEPHSSADRYMAAGQWHSPHDEMARLEAAATEAAAAARDAAPVVGLDALNFSYSIHVGNGQPKWTPIQVFADGKKTFSRFPPPILVREAPSRSALHDTQTPLATSRAQHSTY